METKIKIEDLQPADVLLFEDHDPDWLSRLIMMLTGTAVSHAAMSYFTFQKIIHENTPRVAIDDLGEDKFQRHSIHVMRDTQPPGNLDKVLTAAKVYFNDAEPFAMSNLVMPAASNPSSAGWKV